MTLIDRYLQAVRSYLPAAEQDDIVRELSEDIQSQIEEQEAAAGRPLREGELKTLLQQFGHPLVLAARYRPNRHVVGPTLFPVYWQVLKIGLLGALVVHGAIGIALVAGGAPLQSIVDVLARFPFTTGVTVFGWITLVFAFVDRTELPWLRTWDPGKLPDVPSQAPVSRLALAGECLWSTAFLVWWVLVPRFPSLMLGPGASFLALAPSWHRLHLPLAVLWGASVTMLWLLLLRPRLLRFRAAARVAAHAVALVAAALLLRSAPLVIPAAGTAVEHAASLARLVNVAVQIGLSVFIVVTIVEILRELWRMYRAAPLRDA
jgi:hypothetical protein